VARSGDRRIRRALGVILAVATFLAASALLMGICDTRRSTEVETTIGKETIPETPPRR
jgi:hypothetical protein